MKRAPVIVPALVALLGAATLEAAAQQPPGKVAIQGARVVPVEGPEVADGTVLIDGGRIVAVGPRDRVAVPYDATVIDGTGKVVFPGMVLAHTSVGLDRENEPLPVTPFLDVYDAIDPSSLAFEDALRDGVTTLHVIQGHDTVIGAVGRAVHPLGLTVEEMTVRAPTGLKLSVAAKAGWDRVRQRAALREAFAALADAVDDAAERRYEEEETAAGRRVTVPPARARELGRPLVREQDLDERQRALFLLAQGRLDAYVYCERAMDVGPALALAREQGFLARTTLVLGAECHRAVEEVRASGRPVVLPPDPYHRELDPATGREVETFLPRVFADAGVPFALTVVAGVGLAERFLWYQAATCVREGVPRETALAAITTVPARVLGLGDRLGAIAPGRDADLLLLTGDPLAAATHVDLVLIGGRVVYERARDFRLRRLTTGEGAPAGGGAREGEGEGGEEGE